MAYITVSQKRNGELYVILEKKGHINISIPGSDSVMVVKASRGELSVKTEEKTDADKIHEKKALSGR